MCYENIVAKNTAFCAFSPAVLVSGSALNAHYFTVTWDLTAVKRTLTVSQKLCNISECSHLRKAIKVGL